MKRKTSPGRVITFLILLAGACTMILPFAWMLVTSLKEANLVYTIPPQWIPKPVDWKNYADVWSAAAIFGVKVVFRSSKKRSFFHMAKVQSLFSQ